MTDTNAIAATIRANAPGRTERPDRLHLQPSADFARAIRDSAPGRS